MDDKACKLDAYQLSWRKPSWLADLLLLLAGRHICTMTAAA
jgi:hypothetical protein